jgi:hypothetical protein
MASSAAILSMVLPRKSRSPIRFYCLPDPLMVHQPFFEQAQDSTHAFDPLLILLDIST